MYILNRGSLGNQKLITVKGLALKFMISLVERAVHHGRWLEDGGLMQLEDLVFVAILRFLNFICFITCHKIFEFEVLQVVLMWHPSCGSCAQVWTAALAWPESQNYKRWDNIIPEKSQIEKMKTEVRGSSGKLKGKEQERHFLIGFSTKTQWRLHKFIKWCFEIKSLQAREAVGGGSSVMVNQAGDKSQQVPDQLGRSWISFWSPASSTKGRVQRHSCAPNWDLCLWKCPS